MKINIHIFNDQSEKLSWYERLIDQFLGSDPGLNRLILATRTILSIGAILFTEYLFVHFTHALQIKTVAGMTNAQLTQIHVANHEFLIIAMLVGAIMGMMSSFGVNDTTAKGQVMTMLMLPLFMIPVLAFGILIGPHRFIAMASLALILSLGAYMRRFGPRGFIAGAIMFIGFFLGFFTAGAIKFSDIGWLAAEIGVGLITAMVIRFGLFYPKPAKNLRRIQRAYYAKSRKVSLLALKVFDNPDSKRDARRLHRSLVQLNEAALMIDAQLGDPNATADNVSSQQLHQQLFDIELALTNIARFTPILSRLKLPQKQLTAARNALISLTLRNLEDATKNAQQLRKLIKTSTQYDSGKDDVNFIVPHRFAISVISLCDGINSWNNAPIDEVAKEQFKPAVKLAAGFLPGSAAVSGSASLEGGATGKHRSIQPYTRTAIQMFIAVSIAIFIGDQISPRRFYWAVIATFVSFMGVNNSSEQVRKALFRVIGTIVGIALGSLLVNIIGSHTNWSLATILIALFFGLYLMRISYVFMVIGVTIMVSQLYVELGEYTSSLLVLRLKETAIGAVITIIVVTLVIPLRTKRVLNVALRQYITAIDELIQQASSILLDKKSEDKATLHEKARSVDAAYQALYATARPLRRSLAGNVDEEIVQMLRLTTAARSFSRNLVIDIDQPLDKKLRKDIEGAINTLSSSLKNINEVLETGKKDPYTRASALFDRAERVLEKKSGKLDNTRLAIRDMQLLDGTMANIAKSFKIPIADYDTSQLSKD